MKTKRLALKKEPSQIIEEFCRGRLVLFGVISCLLLGLTKADGALLRTMRSSYAHDFGLIDEYAREEPTRTPISLGSEIRLITTSGG